MKMTISKKLKLSFSLIFILLLFTAVFSILSLQSSIQQIEKIILNDQMLQYKLLDLEKYLLEEINTVKDIFAFGNNEFLYNKKIKYYNGYKSLISSEVNEIPSIAKNTNFYKMKNNSLDNLYKEIDKITSILDRALGIYKIKGKKAATNYLNSKNIYKHFRNITLISSKNKNHYEAVFNAAISKKQNTILAISVIFIIVILIAIFVTNAIAKKFTENIKYLILSAEQVSLGQLDTPIETKSGDELEDISKIFEYLRIEIKKNIEKLRALKK